MHWFEWVCPSGHENSKIFRQSPGPTPFNHRCSSCSATARSTGSKVKKNEPIKPARRLRPARRKIGVGKKETPRSH
jgi:hypothetical protein